MKSKKLKKVLNKIIDEGGYREYDFYGIEFLDEIENILEVINEREVLGLIISSNASNFIGFDYLFLCYLNGIYENQYIWNIFNEDGSIKGWWYPSFSIIANYIWDKYKYEFLESEVA